MKRVLGLIVVLCLVFLSVSAFAEGMVTDGTPLELDDFMLNLDAGISYTPGRKTSGESHVITLNNIPLHEGDFQGTTISAMYIDDPDLDEKEYLESHIKQAEEAPGLNVHFTDPTEFNLAGEAGMSTEYSFEGAGIVCCCRVICIGSKGYVFTITSYSLEAYEAAVELLNNAIVWH